MTIAGFALEQLFILPIAIFAFIALLTIIVFFHEYGHFSAARALGVRVEVFSIGFGPPIAQWTDRKGTEWRIAWLPFGGYVRFFGDSGEASAPDERIVAARRSDEEGAQDDPHDDPHGDEPHPATTQFPRPGDEEELAARLTPEERKVCFHFKPVWARAIVVAAGPMANFVLATAIFFAILMTFGAYVAEPKIGEVVPDSAAEAAGFEAGDLIVSVNGRELRRFDDLQMMTRLGAGERFSFTVERDGALVELKATPRRQEIEDAFGNRTPAGVLGLVADRDALAFVRYDAAGAFGESLSKVWGIIAGTVKFLTRLAFGKESADQLGGPIKMAQYAGQSAMSGFDGGDGPSFFDRLKISLVNFINLAAVVSVSIGFLNLLPVPVLDGGHLLYYGYEAIAGRPLGARAQAIGFRVGIILLASFMLFVTWNDISNLFSSFSS